MADRQKIFEQYMRGDELGLNDGYNNGARGVEHPQQAQPPPVSRPPLYPGAGGHTPKVTPGAPPRTPSATPPTQPLATPTPAPHPPAPTPVLAATPTPNPVQYAPLAGGHYDQEANAALERHKQMLRMQENEIVQLETNMKSLQVENRHLTDKVSSMQGSEGGIRSEYERLKSDYAELQRQTEEAESLTTEAGNLLQKVQTDLDHAQVDLEAVKTEMTGIVSRLLPDEELSTVSVSDMVSTAGRMLEQLIITITNESSSRKNVNDKEIDNLKLSEKAAKAEVVKLRESLATAASGGNSETLQKVKKLERELETSMKRNSELVENVTKLQNELADTRSQGNDESVTQVARMRAVYEVSNAELQERIQDLESELRRVELTRSDEERQRQSLGQLLKKTEQALKRTEEELSAERNKSINILTTPCKGQDTSQQFFDQSDAPVQGELYKLGMSTGHKPATWTRRWFVADASCLQYFERPEDFERKDPGLVKGVRYYASQHMFVPRFRADGPLNDPATHPKASDPKMYYFGFVPKHDNSLSTQPFLLRTSSKEVWLAFCRVLSKAIAPSSPVLQTPSRSHGGSFLTSPELSGITPPVARSFHEASENEFQGSTLGNELKKTEETMKVLMAEQGTTRRRLEAADKEAEELRDNLLAAGRDADVKAKTIEIYKKEVEKVNVEANKMREQVRSLTAAIEAANQEVASLRVALDSKRSQEIAAIEGHGVKPVTREACVMVDNIGAKNVTELQGRLREALDKNQQLATEQEEVSSKLREQEAHHDAQIAAFCDQVIKDMDAIRAHSKKEIQKSDDDWQKEVAIWQQLVAEKEQQIAAAAFRDRDNSDDELDDSGWKVIGGSSTAPTVLSLKLSSTGLEIDAAPTTYGTRIAVDKRRLVQLSVSDDPSARDSMARTWRFKSMNGDHSTVVLSLSILPNAQAAARRHSVTSTSSLARKGSPLPRPRSRSRSGSISKPPARRPSHVFVP